MQEASADPRVPELDEGNLGRPESPETSDQNNVVLEEFAQKMTEDIMHWFLSQLEMVERDVVARFNGKQEMLAEGLALAVVEEALMDVCRGESALESVKSAEDGGLAKVSDQTDDDFLEMEPRTYEGSNPKISQSGLPALGSLDYPDAPPTTPLLPELQRSRYSFAKKLKGTLANIFMPSPPPPTPKEEDDSAKKDPRAELMEHLMQSLSTEDLARECLDVRGHSGGKMEAFAECLSCDIMDSVLLPKTREQMAEHGDLHELADLLAEAIITFSLDEARMIV